MPRSLPVLLLVACTQLSQVGAGLAALWAAEPHGCCAGKVEAGEAAAEAQGAALASIAEAPCAGCCHDGVCAAGCDDCKCCGGKASMAAPPVASAQPACFAPPLELAFQVERDPETRVVDTLERPPRAPA